MLLLKSSCNSIKLHFTWTIQLLYLALAGVSVGEGNGNPLQYSCLKNPMDGGAWCAAVHGVPKSQTQLSDFTFTFHFHALEKKMATHSSVLYIYVCICMHIYIRVRKRKKYICWVPTMQANVLDASDHPYPQEALTSK